MEKYNLEYLQAEPAGDNLFILLSKRLDTLNFNEVEIELEILANEYPDKKFILVASNLSYISSAGLRVLMKLAKPHKSVEIIDVNPEVLKVFNTSGFSDALKINESGDGVELPQKLKEALERESNIDESKVGFRPLRNSDLDAIIDIGFTTVGDYSANPSVETGKNVIALDVANSLDRADYAAVATYHGRPVAVLLGRSDVEGVKGRPLPKLAKMRNKLGLLAQKEGRKMYKGLKASDQFDRDIVESAGKRFDGELVYFNQLPQLYDTEVGFKLVERFRQYLQEKGSHNFYFLTHSGTKSDYFSRKPFREVDMSGFFASHPRNSSVILYEYDVETPLI